MCPIREDNRGMKSSVARDMVEKPAVGLGRAKGLCGRQCGVLSYTEFGIGKKIRIDSLSWRLFHLLCALVDGSKRQFLRFSSLVRKHASSGHQHVKWYGKFHDDQRMIDTRWWWSGKYIVDLCPFGPFGALSTNPLIRYFWYVNILYFTLNARYHFLLCLVP